MPHAYRHQIGIKKHAGWVSRFQVAYKRNPAMIHAAIGILLLFTLLIIGEYSIAHHS